ncbi:hypothetical protein SAMN04488505_102494 [Chitinophaga rupis]|uniref:Por secretion system C-terminal sorting domain-containing protein n=1 Tax=Chitinophaga rupis TaxID=573321 RepID=A0A1H7R1K5_9BACT|nr:T9SS type A sorting domain-containing protein [Chitinophaga rupis]SEL53795.1 hypothetical protein SAMN04488505_102494 [Chitinophaga rupis]
MNSKNYKLSFSTVIIQGALLFSPLLSFSQTSWKGTASTSWNNSANWTAGIPTASVDATVGDASFTGPYQPTISTNSATKNLTIGTTGTPVLTIAKNLTVAGNVTIQAGGTITQRGVTVTVKGNWDNAGTYTTTQNNARVAFGGTTQSIGGAVATTFRRLAVNAGSTVTLNTNMSVSNSFTVSGTFIPAENATPRVITGTTLTVDVTGILNVTAANFTDNYVLSGAVTLSAGSVVAYSATLINQTILPTLTYSTLRVSGAGTIKTPSANLNALNATTAATGRIEVLSGTLNLSTFTANRGTTVAGGGLSVSNGATLQIGGAGNFPANFSTNALSLNSTVSYNGGSQTVSPQSYGNLLLTGSTGTAVKTMPGTAFTIEGNLTSTQGGATAVSFTAASNITVNGSVSIGAGTTFNGGSFIHNVAGSWAIAGTFSGGTSTVRMTGAGSVISGTGTHGFYNLTIAANKITATPDAAITIAGDLADIEPGSFTHTTGGTVTMTGASKTISGPDFVFDNLVISGTVSAATTITLNGNLSVTGTFNGTGGEVDMLGAGKTISGAGSITFGTIKPQGTVTTAISFSINAFLDVSGSFTATAGTITFTGTSSLNGTANLFNATIAGTSLRLSSNAVMGIAGTFTVSSGVLDVTTSTPNTISYNGTTSQTIYAGTYHHLLLSNTGAKTAGGAITVNGDINIASGCTFNGSSFTHNLLGNWTNAGTYTAGSSTVAMTGTSSTTISGVTTFNALTVNKTTSSQNVTLLANVTADVVNMTNGGLRTGANTLTITTTRNGSGIILGNIRRQHGFSLGTAYAFESPDNTITLTGVNSLTAITVSVTSGAVSDFPAGGSVNREYSIAMTGLLNLSLVTLRLHYEDNELNGNAEANIGLWRNTGSGWSTVGKTANSTTANYVEQSGLLSATGRWSLSDNANIVRWNGSVSSNWATAANWTSVQGAPTTPPGANDIVEIGTAAFTNQPVISSSVTVKSITLGSVQAVTLGLAAGGSLTAQGNITGAWTGNATHTLNVNDQTMTVNGSLALSDGVSGHAINLNTGSGTVNIAGALTHSGGANITFTGAGALNIGGDYTYTNGSFTAGSSTVTYNGTAAQNVAGLTYNNLVVQKTGGTATTTAAATVNGNLSVTAGTLTLNAATSITGNVTIASGAVLGGSSADITVNGNWANSGTFTPAGSTVNFTASGAQSISASNFNNLNINKASGTATLTGNLAVNGSLSIASGTLDLSSFTANRGSLGGTMSLAAGTLLLAGGANNFPANYSVYTLNSSSTVHYNGTVAQTVAGGQTYGHLIFSNGGANAKTLSAISTVNGDLTINSGATLNSGGFTMNLYGNWVNSGTYTPSTGTVTLNGTSKTITGNTTFNRVTVFGSYAVAGSDINYNGLLLVATGGSFDGGSGQATINGDLTNNGSLISNGTTTFSGTSLQTIRFVNAVTSNSSGIINFNGSVSPVLNSTSSPSYATLNVNNTGGVTASVGWNVFVAFNISSGATFNGGASTHNIFGSFTNNGTVTSSGTLFFGPSSARTIKLTGTGFTSTGTVLFGGTGAIAVTGTPTALNNVVITNTAGVTPATGWNIGGNFQIGNTGIFNAGSNTYTVGGDIESNGTLNGGTSIFTMSAAAGYITGSPGTTFYDFTITGSITAESDFNVSRNFNVNSSSTAFTATPGSLVMTGAAAAVINGTQTSFTLAQLEVAKDAGSTVTLSKNLTSVASLDITSGTLDISTFTLTQDVGDFNIDDNARLIIRGNNTLPVFTTYNLDTLSTVEYAGVTQAVSAAATYGNLTISAAGTKTAAAVLKILNDFSLSNGTFVPGSFADTIGGNWNMTSGAFTSTGSTMVFAGTGTQQVFSTGAFQNFTTNKTAGLVNLSSNITINGVLNFIGRNIRTSSNVVIIPTGGSVTNAAQATGWVYGNLQKQVATGSGISRTFEIGDSLNYTPATAVFASISTGGSLQAVTVSSDHPAIASSGLNALKSINRYWSFTNTGTVFTTASVTLNWVAGDMDAGIVTTSLKAGNYNGTTWSLPSTNTATSTSITATGVTALGSLVVAQLTTATTWTGAVSTSWFVNGNWSTGAIPTAATNVTVPSGLTNYPLINTGTATAQDLSIQTGASVTVSSALLQLGGAITSTGTFTAANGSIEMNGTAAQTIPANTWATNTILNLTINNTAGVTLAGTLNISGVLKVTAGQLNTGGYLILTSTATRTALIDGSGGGQVLGNVTMQRYLPSRFGYKYFSSPFQAATVNEFANEINLGAAFPAFYRYEENQASSGWTAYTNTASPLVPLRGYAANFGAATTPLTVDITGVVNNGTVSLTLLNHNQPYTLGFQLAGNPYPSPIDWTAASGWTRTNIDNAIYYFDAGSTNQYTGTYSSYINGVSSNGIATYIIPAMQGFFVHVSNGAYPVTGTLSVNNNARVNDAAPVFHREKPNTSPLLRLSAGFSDEGFTADPVVIYFETGASKAFDTDRDALKILNTNPQVPNLFVQGAADQAISICAWPAQPDSTDVIPLQLRTERAGMIAFHTTSLERIPPGWHIYLRDSVSGTTEELSSQFSYRLYLEAGDYKNRFSLVFKKEGITPVPDGSSATFQAYSINGQLFGYFDKVPDERCTINVINLQGRVLFRKELNSNGRHLLGSQYSNGIYIVNFHTKQQVVSKKVFIHN